MFRGEGGGGGAGTSALARGFTVGCRSVTSGKKRHPKDHAGVNSCGLHGSMKNSRAGNVVDLCNARVAATSLDRFFQTASECRRTVLFRASFRMTVNRSVVEPAPDMNLIVLIFLDYVVFTVHSMHFVMLPSACRLVSKPRSVGM
jgi:hypothetical protein